MDNKLSFINDNPGAVRHGNFINYYQFHPPENRLNLISYDVFDKSSPFVALDIGCNAGDLTIALYKQLESNGFNCHILGIDIDPILIKRAKEQNEHDNITFECVNFMENNKRHILSEYLTKFNLKKFSAIFSFSITMWIHLNNGDDGLKNFLKEITNYTDTILIEPQPWKCYKSAVTRLKKSGETFPLFKELKIKQEVENVIENFIENENFDKVFESDRTKWERKIVIFNRSKQK